MGDLLYSNFAQVSITVAVAVTMANTSSTLKTTSCLPHNTSNKYKRKCVMNVKKTVNKMMRTRMEEMETMHTTQMLMPTTATTVAVLTNVTRLKTWKIMDTLKHPTTLNVNNWT